MAAAQKAGERRLAIGAALIYEEDLSEVEGDPSELAGPYCGCDTCVVREILDAGWPHLVAAGDALIEENAKLRAELERLR